MKAWLLFTIILVLSACVRLDQAMAPGARLSEVIYVAFDTETTGLNSRRDRVIELAAVRFNRSRLLDSRSWLIDPGIPIPEASRRIHGISDAMVKGKPRFPTVFVEFEKFTAGSVLVAHNAGFDARFMNAELARNGLTSPRRQVLDTLRLARAWFPGLSHYNLGALVQHLNLPAGTVHRAESDAQNTALLFRKGLELYRENAPLSEISPPSTPQITIGKAERRLQTMDDRRSEH